MRDGGLQKRGDVKMKQILILNLKIFTAHIVACVLGMWLFAIFFGIDIHPRRTLVTYSLIIIFIILALYVLAGFWGNNGKLQGKKPIVSIFWLSVMLLIIYPLVIFGKFEIAFLMYYYVVPFGFLFSMIDGLLGFYFPDALVLISFIVMILLPSSLAALGFWLKNVYRKRKVSKTEI